MSIPRSARLIFKGSNGHTTSVPACDLAGAGCKTVDDLKCSDGSSCLKGSFSSCHIDEITVPKGIDVQAYKAGFAESWQNLCHGKSSSYGLGPTSFKSNGACGISVKTMAGYTCETKLFDHWLKKIGIEGSHENLIIGAVVAAIGLFILFGVKSKKHDSIDTSTDLLAPIAGVTSAPAPGPLLG